MAKQTQPVFTIIVHGTYKTNDKLNPMKNFTDVKAFLDEERMENYNKFLKKFILPTKLRNAYPDFMRLRSFEIEDVLVNDHNASLEHLPEDIQVRLMTRPQMESFIRRRKLPIDPDSFPTNKDLRALLFTAVTSSKDALLRKLDKVGASLADLSALKALDPELSSNGSPSQSTETQNQTTDNDSSEDLTKLKNAELIKRINDLESLLEMEQSTFPANMPKAKLIEKLDNLTIEQKDLADLTDLDGDL